MSTSDAATATATVDGERVPTRSLWVPAMNFGQFRWPARVGTYEIEVPREAFLAALEAPYRVCVEELRADEPNDPDGTPYLREIGYPGLAVVFRHPRQLFELVSVFLYEDLFEAILRPNSIADLRFMINSVDRVEARGDAVLVGGRGYYGGSGFARR